jgi:phosphoserine phosphatase
VEFEVCATRLEEIDGRWTGRIVGEAMCGGAKARAIRRIADELDLDLAQCYAYGNSRNDEEMLAVVGRPMAVNPSIGLARTAGKKKWPVLQWGEKKI